MSARQTIARMGHFLRIVGHRNAHLKQLAPGRLQWKDRFSTGQSRFPNLGPNTWWQLAHKLREELVPNASPIQNGLVAFEVTERATSGSQTCGRGLPGSQDSDWAVPGALDMFRGASPRRLAVADVARAGGCYLELAGRRLHDLRTFSFLSTQLTASHTFLR